jgi:hypothetical protein
MAIGVPSSQVAANYAANDHHRRTYEIRYFNALFDVLPDRSIIVRDHYATKSTARRSRDPPTVPWSP